MVNQETYQDQERVYTEIRQRYCLHNWVFHYNPFTELWNAIHRDRYVDYWYNTNSNYVLKSTQIYTLVDLILKIENNKLNLEDIK
jgi:hypothetical protein